MKKQSAGRAWTMLILSLPKGMASLLTVVAGLSVSLPLSVFLIGLPLLAETLVLSTRMMDAERRYTDHWRNGSTDEPIVTSEHTGQWKGWKALLAVLVQGRSYRSLLYGLLQLPIGIAAFVAAIVLPVTAWAVMLSPLAYQVSVRMYAYDLFADDYLMNSLFADWSSYLRSWVYGGVGLVLVLLVPVILRAMGRLYAGWVKSISGKQPRNTPAIEQEAMPISMDALREPQLNA
ncbi:hypothetical protein E5161_17610 [Cohnella pontilimi]|uniref:Putative sensor domain-containing protein n=1 Tax=Cohnella pontilimi TaxID=2564100 RepID=A0A4U0F720_9BACL|nr:sensor domain-containing protein [Cohnella pontilimi]TJY39764.1 hypothetical protein E5161_17610 [Cohnella pontilimi]